MQQQLIERYMNYFRDPSIGDGILGVGDEGLACDNLRIALRALQYPTGSGQGFDEALKDCVESFQKDFKHNVTDGFVGPGTSRRLTEVLLDELGEEVFQGMQRPGSEIAPSVFLCYARADDAVVDKVDQWLQDKGVRVWRDKRDIPPGTELPDRVKAMVQQADKVVVVYSKQAKGRDWPAFEIKVAEEVERDGRRVLIYLVLDETRLPLYDPNRVAVQAKGRTLRAIGEDLLHGIRGTREWTRVPYDEDEILT